MKQIISIIFLAILISSCEPQYAIKEIEVIYLNGSHETITVKYDELLPCSGIFFNDGCIYLSHEQTRYDTPYKNCIVCGVRKFRIK